MSAPPGHTPKVVSGIPVAEPGQSTTEFWGKTAIQVVTLGFTLVVGIQSHDPMQVGLAGLGIIAALEAAYGVARSIRKQGTAG